MSNFNGPPRLSVSGGRVTTVTEFRQDFVNQAKLLGGHYVKGAEWAFPASREREVRALLKKIYGVDPGPTDINKRLEARVLELMVQEGYTLDHIAAVTFMMLKSQPIADNLDKPIRALDAFGNTVPTVVASIPGPKMLHGVRALAPKIRHGWNTLGGMAGEPAFYVDDSGIPRRARINERVNDVRQDQFRLSAFLAAIFDLTGYQVAWSEWVANQKGYATTGLRVIGGEGPAVRAAVERQATVDALQIPRKQVRKETVKRGPLPMVRLSVREMGASDWTVVGLFPDDAAADKAATEMGA